MDEVNGDNRDNQFFKVNGDNRDAEKKKNSMLTKQSKVCFNSTIRIFDKRAHLHQLCQYFFRTSYVRYSEMIFALVFTEICGKDLINYVI